MYRSRPADPVPSMVDNIASAASQGLVPRRRRALTVTEAVDTATVLVGAASFASAAGAIALWRRRRPR
ncbi:MAG: hypothetical protein ACJ72A_17820 [Nocardioidaceae bacterium]